MGRAGVSDRLEAPAAAVWDLVRWENESALVDSGAFARVDYEERRPVPGAARYLRTADGQAVRERLESVAPETMSYTYRVLEPGPMPLAEYVGEVRIEPEGDHACRLSVACTFTTRGITDAQWVEMYESIQRRLFAFLRERLGA